MIFLDRAEELDRLRRLAAAREGGLAVVYGRRRVGKTRLLLEWLRERPGVYAVADQSTPAIQRRFLAAAIAAALPTFGEVEYPDWRSLLVRLGREARAAGWRGPLVIDELPYLVSTSPELPSVLQAWLDHEARAAGLPVALAGSSQRMMQGLVLSREAPLYGRATEILDVRPLPPSCLFELGMADSVEAIDFYAAWGGIPRYWELATARGTSTAECVADLVLDPLGPLHGEPDRLLLEELPSAVELRPILDAIGGGVHRVSEIAGRMGRAATSLARPLQRLIELGLVRRETPFGESERSKRSLYRIADPLFRLWFSVVAPRLSLLVGAPRRARLALLREAWPALAAEAWEEICRGTLPLLDGRDLGDAGTWAAGQRWWHGHAPEWDVVSQSDDGRVLLGEAKWSRRPFSPAQIGRLVQALRARPHPPLGERHRGAARVFALFVPAVEAAVPPVVDGVHVVTGRRVLGLARR